jgi:hypothetical protein
MDISDNHSAAAGPAAAAVGGAGGEAAAAAATTAVLSATGQQCIKERCQSMSMSRLPLIDASVCCALLCVPFFLLFASAVSRVTSAGLPACERCGRELNKVKHVHRHGPGHACHPRCKPFKRPPADDAQASVREESASAATAVAARPEKRVRRAKSDPGEQQAVQTFSPRRLRLRAMKRPQPERRKLKQEKEDAASSLLEQTHARRVAALAAAAAAILSFLRHISA